MKYFVIPVSTSQSKPSLSNSSNVGGKAMNSIKKAVAIKSDSEEAKPLMATNSTNGRYVFQMSWGKNTDKTLTFKEIMVFFIPRTD